MIRTIGDAVKEAWAESGMSGADFATSIGRDRKTLYSYARGATVPDSATLVKIAKLAKDPAAWMASLVG